jgi:hypothetical protein
MDLRAHGAVEDDDALTDQVEEVSVHEPRF